MRPSAYCGCSVPWLRSLSLHHARDIPNSARGLCGFGHVNQWNYCHECCSPQCKCHKAAVPPLPPKRDTCDACASYRRIRVYVDIWGKCHKCHGLVLSPSIPRPSCLRWQRNPRFSSVWTKRLRVPACSPAASAHSFHDANRVLVSSQLSSRRSQRSSIHAPIASSLSK